MDSSYVFGSPDQQILCNYHTSLEPVLSTLYTTLMHHTYFEESQILQYISWDYSKELVLDYQ